MCDDIPKKKRMFFLTIVVALETLVLRAAFSAEQTNVLLPRYPMFRERDNNMLDIIRIIKPHNPPSMLVYQTFDRTSVFLHYDFTIMACAWHHNVKTLEKSLIFSDMSVWLSDFDITLSAHVLDMDDNLAWELSQNTTMTA